MTFEEAKEKINELFTDLQVPGYSVGDFDPEFTGTFEDLEEIIESLEEEYSTTDKLSVEKLQEQLNTAKYFFKNILDVNPNLNKGHVSHLENCVRVMKNSAQKALAAIGGEND